MQEGGRLTPATRHTHTHTETATPRKRWPASPSAAWGTDPRSASSFPRPLGSWTRERSEIKHQEKFTRAAFQNRSCARRRGVISGPTPDISATGGGGGGVTELVCNFTLSIYLVEHVSEIVLWIDPGGHCVAEEYKVLFQRRGVRQHVNRQLNGRRVCGSSPARRLPGWRWSSCRSLWTQSLSPRCLLYFAERCTWRQGRPHLTSHISKRKKKNWINKCHYERLPQISIWIH